MASPAARALDAADGVIDGRYFGRPIVQAGAGVPIARAAYPAGFVGGNTAAALDAADGVIDGRYFGRPIVQSGAPAFATAYPASYATAYPTTTFAAAPVARAVYPATAGYVPTAGFVGNTAAALDAADGVIDGRYYGRPIVQAGAPALATAYPASYATAYPTTTFAAAPVARAVYPTAGYPTAAYPAAAYPAAAYPAAGFGSTAAALDAADGVIDGRYFGRPIVRA